MAVLTRRATGPGVASQMEMRLDDVVAFEHGAHAVEELGGVDLRAVAVQEAFDEHDDPHRAREQDDPEHRPAIGQ